ncbi:alcohol oxidase [Dentipellis sp. KUC8613]|nr:alcohol oxidase [Dentipellis sp. KUC8613]
MPRWLHNWLTAYPEVSLDDVRDDYDYIIIGGGTAGCVLANRLSADPTKTVLLVERGPSADTWVSRVPLFSMNFLASYSPSWKHTTVVQKELGRPLEFYTGSALGGSSRINICLYTRGLPAEYDALSAAGRQGWAWNDVLPYFVASEKSDVLDSPKIHGNQGEWRNRTLGSFSYPSYEAYLKACQDLGFPYITDLNSAQEPSIGCARLDHTVDDYGHRHSTFRAFLPKDLALQRKANLHICTNTIVQKLDVRTDADGRKVAQGVYLASKGGSSQRNVRASREVVICGGPFGSPKVLMLSGIGPAKHLKDMNIPVVKNLPAVGSNLQDHVMVDTAWRIPLKDSFSIYLVRPWLFIVAVIRHLLFGTGFLLGAMTQLSLFASSASLDKTGRPLQDQSTQKNTLPDLEILPGTHPHPNEEFDKKKGRFTLITVLLHPASKGTVRLASSDPEAPLVIDPAILTNSRDYSQLRAGVRLSLQLASQMHTGHAYPLDPLAVPADSSDAAIDAHIRQRADTAYHYSSTCRMAPENDPDGGGVVDDQLRVHGVDHLRVADSSIFPWVLGTHLQAPAVMVAEKCADMILKESA